MKKKILRIVFLLAIIVSLIGFGVTLKMDTSKFEYRTARVTRGNISQVVSTRGVLKPVSEANVGSQASGKIEHVYVKVNDEVKKGQLLAEIDPSLSETQLNQSRANLETARINFEQASRDLQRTKMLLDKQYVAKVDMERAQQSYVSARNGYDAAKIQVQRDELTLSYTKITSPLDGVITWQDASLGQTLAANFQAPMMFKIAQDLATMKIEANFSESDIPKIKHGMEASFSIDAFPDRNFKGTIDTINLDPNADRQNGAVYTVIILVDNPDKILFPGMTAYINVILSEQKDVLSVPTAALHFTPPAEEAGGIQNILSNSGISIQTPEVNAQPGADESTNTIYVLRGGNLTPVKVKTGASDSNAIEVNGDSLAEGDIVVIGASHKRK